MFYTLKFQKAFQFFHLVFLSVSFQGNRPATDIKNKIALAKILFIYFLPSKASGAAVFLLHKTENKH